MKKSAIGIGLLILIALLLFRVGGKPVPKAPPRTSQFHSEFVDFTLPAPGWACVRAEGTGGCIRWECHDMNLARTPLYVIRAQYRPLSQTERAVDGRWVDVNFPMFCGPDLSQIPPSQVTTVMIDGVDWRVLRPSPGLPIEGYTSRFYLTREAGLSIQVEASVKSGRNEAELFATLKPALESLKAHGNN